MLKFITFFILVIAASSLIAKEVPLGFIRIARECNTPNKILYAIAMTETEMSMGNGKSGIWHNTINFQKKPYLFRNRIDMYNFAKKLISNGYQSFDIGVMQINWKWQKNKVKSLWELTDIKRNIQVGCQILKEGYNRRHDWILAAGYYHSPSNKKYAQNYINAFKKKMKKII